MDCFFVSVERQLNPSLQHKPLIVSQNNRRSVVTACSYETRSYGVHSGMPIEQAKKRCPHALIVPPSPHYYQHYSNQIYQFLKLFSPSVEQASIDEFYIDLTGCSRLYGNIETFSWQLKDRLKTTYQLPSSFGLGTNKLIAKIACTLAKQEGFISVKPGEEETFLAPFPISFIPGIGPSTQRTLQQLGVHSIWQLAQLSKQDLTLYFGDSGYKLYTKSRGLGSQVCIEKKQQKSFSIEHTFDHDLHDSSTLTSTLLAMLETLSYRLRQHKKYAQQLTLKCRYSNFKIITRSCSFEPNNQDHYLKKKLHQLFISLPAYRKGIRLLGLSYHHLCSDNRQPLFKNDQQWARLYHAIDRTRQRFGKDIINKATQLKIKDYL